MKKNNYQNDFSHADRKLLNDFQHEFPITARPYKTLAGMTGLDEETVINHYKYYTEQGYISRIGPVFKCNTLGSSTLVAMSVPESELEDVADKINNYPEVNHNYERENKFNLWFVVAAEDESSLKKILRQIEMDTGYECLSLPMLESFHIDLGFDLNWS